MRYVMGASISLPLKLHFRLPPLLTTATRTIPMSYRTHLVRQESP